MKSAKYQYLIFDLDGTLANTSKGIFCSINYALKKIKAKNVLFEKQLIGPSPKTIYFNYFKLSENLANKAVFFHRDYNDKYGYKKSQLYSSEIKVLKKLSRNYKLGIVTLKKETTAKKLLKFHKIDTFFCFVYGITDNESVTKSSLLNKAINEQKIKRCIYIGDTQSDYDAAKKLGIDFCFVSYGFGDLKNSSNHLTAEKFNDFCDLF